MEKFRVELWRIGKFILITAAVDLVFAFINTQVINSLAASNTFSFGTWLSISSWVFTLLTTATAALLNRYFTFRATEKWFIALPVMLLAAFAWQFLQAFPMAVASKHGAEAAMSMSHLLSMVWPVLAYLLQRYVIYCHTTDQNGWHHRSHPANEE